MITGEHTYVVRTLRTYVMYILSYGIYFISPRHFDVQEDIKARINRAESRQPCLISSIQGPHQSSLVQHPSPVSILCKSISGRHRAVRVADGPMTARCRFT